MFDIIISGGTIYDGSGAPGQRRMTDNPARCFGIRQRGQLKKGYFADVVLFDAERVIDTATYDDPKQYPVGIPYVLVNGQVAVDAEHCTGVMAGHAVP